MIHPVKRALLSVSDKTGLVAFATFLAEQGVELLSTGGTAAALRAAGLKVKEVSEHTGFPEMLDGRVKTLHPKIHGGLLGRRHVPEHAKAMGEHGIAAIDLVVINLYPFEATVAKGAGYDDCIENIDIGGPAMLRSAAKNHESVAVIVDPADYACVREEMLAQKGTTLPTRKTLAAKAYARTASYDAAISRWFARTLGERFPARSVSSGELKQVLRYGENPHQQAAFYALSGVPVSPGITTARQVQGKELSYNNINDTDAAFELVSEFEQPAIAIIKHANPCGVAVADNITEAFRKALACDPVSAYGGIIAANRTLDAATVEAIDKLFLEVIIAPDADAAALALLEKKKNLRLLLTGGMSDPARFGFTVKAVSGGFLLQERDAARVKEGDVKAVSKRAPSAAELRDMIFAFTVAKHVKSNAIVIARDQATIGIGAGQMSRVDSVRLACWKAEEAKLSTKGAVLASDAFFPFDDNVHNAAKAGIAALIQPGGSIRDEEVVKAADQYGMAMVLTGVRHFPALIPMSIQSAQLQAAGWFVSLRDRICAELEKLEDELSGPFADHVPGRFERKPWNRDGGGGGEMSLLRGRVFEKAGVNISTVHGEFSDAMRKEMPAAKDDPRFWASGISVVVHPRSPLVPAVHMNTRMLVLGDGKTHWFGGGADLTPVVEDTKDTNDFHAALSVCCGRFSPDYYPKYKQWCDEYFYLKHRNEPRGVGGIFYDQLNSGDLAHDFAFTQTVGETFLSIYPQLVRRHMNAPWTPEQREQQQVKRGRYVEFNLLYDRGTRFGLMTGGNIEAILMSLPPEVKWP